MLHQAATEITRRSPPHVFPSRQRRSLPSGFPTRNADGIALRSPSGDTSRFVSPSERLRQRLQRAFHQAAARSREVSCLDAHKREETSRSMRRSRIMRDSGAVWAGFPWRFPPRTAHTTATRQDSETRQDWKHLAVYEVGRFICQDRFLNWDRNAARVEITQSKVTRSM
jgi:hypothetical protein